MSGIASHGLKQKVLLLLCIQQEDPSSKILSLPVKTVSTVKPDSARTYNSILPPAESVKEVTQNADVIPVHTRNVGANILPYLPVGRHWSAFGREV